MYLDSLTTGLPASNGGIHHSLVYHSFNPNSRVTWTIPPKGGGRGVETLFLIRLQHGTLVLMGGSTVPLNNASVISSWGKWIMPNKRDV